MNLWLNLLPHLVDTTRSMLDHMCMKGGRYKQNSSDLELHELLES